MATKKSGERKVGRDATTGRFISIKEAKRRPTKTVIETIKRKKGK
jgi:hypothetical protein